MTEDSVSPERRAARRVPLALSVRVAEPAGARYHTRDLSWEGLFLCTARPLELGEELELSLELGTGASLKATGVVARTQIVQMVGEQPLLSGMALRFTRLEPGDQERLKRLVEGVWQALANA